MKRTDITELLPDAPKETIDKIMSLNGADINAAKAETDALRQQLAAAPNSDELQQAHAQISQLQTELDGMKSAETVRLTREKVAGDKKIPANLLTGTTEEECTQQADAILAFAKPGAYPNVKDGGEPGHASSRKTRDSFADWAKDNL